MNPSQLYTMLRDQKLDCYAIKELAEELAQVADMWIGVEEDRRETWRKEGIM
jgi:hypothetical protein